MFTTRERVVECSLTLEEAKGRLQRFIDRPKRWYQCTWPFEKGIFRGKIEEDKFILTSTARIDSYLRISGSFSRGENSTRIKLLIKDILPSHNRNVRLILLPSSLLIFGILAYSFLNTIIQNWKINLLLVSLFMITSGGVVILIEILTRGDPNSDDVIDKCARFFNDIFSPKFSIPYDLPGFIRLREPDVFDLDNGVMLQRAGFLGCLLTMILDGFLLLVLDIDIPMFLDIIVLFFLPMFVGAATYVLVCWIAWKRDLRKTMTE